jgi:hypothetical protein
VPLPTRRPSVRWLAPAAALLAITLVAAPLGFGLPSGMDKDVPIYPHDFDQYGCASCHGDKTKLPVGDPSKVTWSIADAKGNGVAGNTYVHGTTYTLTITLHDEQGADKENHAGFNLQASAGKLQAPAGNANVQATKDGTQATHTNAAHTNWTVEWVAPESGAAVFNLLVNDVNGESGADPSDLVYRYGFWLTDEHGAMAGAAASAEPVEFGISLQQYWIGLIGLAGMLFVMVAGFVYLKFVNPHNTDQKDR